MITVKLQFERNIIFNNKSSYTLDNPDTNEKINVVYIGKSRIDGVDMFQFDTNLNKITRHIMYFQYNGFKIRTCSLIHKLEDHSLEYSIIKNNKEQIIDFLMKQFKIDQYDLSYKDAHNSILEYSIIKNNKEQIIDFLMKQFKIDQYDLSYKDAHNSIIRDIKMKLIMG